MIFFLLVLPCLLILWEVLVTRKSRRCPKCHSDNSLSKVEGWDKEQCKQCGEVFNI